MEPFVVSARKYRPKTFKDVVGQKAITDTLEKAIAHNHLAQALLFCGPRGVGKTTCARILAKKINSENELKSEEDFAFNIFELDAASNNSVDDIRNLIDQVRIPPQVGKYKVYIIDEVHMLSQSAFNAFLKTLEEPPKHAIFILATTEKHKIIPTILSRCQIFDFKRITVKDAAEYLQYIAKEQDIIAEPEGLHIIAKKADGAMRDALSIFDRVVSFAGKNLTKKAVTENLNVLDHETYFESTKLIIKGDIPKLLLLFDEILSNGFDGQHYISGLASHFRDLMVAKNSHTLELIQQSEATIKEYKTQAEAIEEQLLLTAMDLANQCDLAYRSSKNQRLLVELTLMKMASVNEGSKEKKKSNYIIPASHYRTNNYSPTNEYRVVENLEQPKTVEEKKPEKPKEISNPPTPISVSNPVNTKGYLGNGLSLKSVAIRQHFLKNQETINTEINKQTLPEKTFTIEEVLPLWEKYCKDIDEAGQKILASNLRTDQPKLRSNYRLEITLPNETMKKEVDREKSGIIAHLRQSLNNHRIVLDVKVNATEAKKYAFTPEEKYEQMRQENPALEVLRKEFDLEL